MTAPGRETAERVTWMTEVLLSCGGHALPAGLRAALRGYKAALLARCSARPWARTGAAARHGRLAGLIGRQVAGGRREPGQRLPSAARLAAEHATRPGTVSRALFVLAVRGQPALENGAYYVLPGGIT